jgi:hypothetical protein
MIAVEHLHELLSYNAETGVFRWRVDKWRAKKGSIAGVVKAGDGSHQIKIDQRGYLAHRLAWLYVHGYWPSNDIDHINGIRDDNRIANLREATRRENLQNTRRRRTNKWGKGVTHVSRQSWQARIRVGSARLHLGPFDTPDEEAHRAYCEAAVAYHGEFARFA